MLATHGYENRRIKIRKRNRRFAPTFQNATKCNAVQQEDRRSPARPLSAGITEQTQSYPPAFKGAPCAAHRSPEPNSKVRTTNVTKCNTKIEYRRPDR